MVNEGLKIFYDYDYDRVLFRDLFLFESDYYAFTIPNYEKYTKKEFIRLSYNDIFRSDYRYHSIIKSKLIKCICDNRKICLIAGGRQQDKREYATVLQLRENKRIVNDLIKLLEEN